MLLYIATKVLYWSLFTAIILIGIGVRYPVQIIKSAFWYQFYRSGFHKRYVQAGRYEYCYYEQGKSNPDKLSLVLVHGFASDKDMWLALVQKFPKDLHIIAFDLLGHGNSSQPEPSEELGLFTLTRRLHEAIDKAKLNTRPFHLVGASMGGAVCGLYSIFYTNDVAKLSLMCPMMKTPIASEFLEAALEGDNALLVKTTDDMQRLLELVLYSNVKYNRIILWTFLQIRKVKAAFNERLYEGILNEEKRQNMNDFYGKISVPCQILWGKEDKIFHISGADHLRNKIVNCVRVDLLERCGHGMTMDRPGLTAKHLLDFRGELQTNSKEYEKKSS